MQANREDKPECGKFRCLKSWRCGGCAEDLQLTFLGSQGSGKWNVARFVGQNLAV